MPRYLLDRHIERGDGARLAVTGVHGDLTYAQLFERVCRVAEGLRAQGPQPEQRLAMFMSDSPCRRSCNSALAMIT
jgi:acyl-coenzyme A synthetase/AMP-(fatty) acid ligase